MILWNLQSMGPHESAMVLERVLAEPEREYLSGLKVPKRRRDFLLGRRAAKTLVGTLLGRAPDRPADPQSIWVSRADDGAPQVWVPEGPTWRRLSVSLSISHSHGVALSALTSRSGTSVGVDLERIEPRSAPFVADFFTDEERAWLEAVPGEKRNQSITALWSAKEAVLKAMRLGLSVDTRWLSCRLHRSVRVWHPFAVRTDNRIWSASDRLRAMPSWPQVVGWWRVVEPFVLTVAAVTHDPLSERLADQSVGVGQTPGAWVPEEGAYHV